LPRRYIGGHQQLIESDSVEHLGSHSIYHGEGHFSAIMRGIDVNAKGTLTEWHADDLGDRIANHGAVDRLLRLHVKFDGSQIDFIILCELLKLGDLRRVPP
jgi:hypothetical protein